jgi:putative acetyltransferase
MAVLPRYQRQGIGSRLVRKGIKECQRINHNIVVVLGHPEYYSRFGFNPAKQKGLHCEYGVPDEAFMMAELIPDALRGRQGLVKYHPVFKNV